MGCYGAFFSITIFDSFKDSIFFSKRNVARQVGILKSDPLSDLREQEWPVNGAVTSHLLAR